ncbi:adenylosuccinate lyase [soil metagenome]
MNQANPLAALSPLDGRYQTQLVGLSHIFSEFALIKNRVRVEVEYFIFLSDQKIGATLTTIQKQSLQKIISDFDESDAEKVKEFEKTTKHDVKAAEYYLRQKLNEVEIDGEEWIHFGLTSEDVNSLAYGLSLTEANKTSILPALKKILAQLTLMVSTTRDVPMLARTHGQAAVPTTVGKEILVFAMRLLPLTKKLEEFQFEAKLSGAVGNLNAHVAAYEPIHWLDLSRNFIETLGLRANIFSTQIVPPESYLEYFQVLQLINGILLDLSQDFWRYISDGYFLQAVEKGQVGSSTMPQKINPIDFENAEGNFGLANALLVFFIQKLPVSRLQRDLSDSTVKRSFGTAFGHCQLGYISLLKGLQKISVNEKGVRAELNTHWEVVTEGIQTILRTSGDATAYEKLKDFSQGQEVSQQNVAQFIEELKVDKETKQKLQKLSPETYLGAVQDIISLGLTELQRELEA